MVERMQDYEAVTDALKWLTVVCYGRLRFANSIFGRINSHEVVSYLSREAIKQVKRIVEANGGLVLHRYVDSAFAWLPNASKADYKALVDEIEEKTGLPMALENVYSWFAFLASRQNPAISVSNRFFGVAENGEHKIRGVALRRGDTCAFAVDIQRQVIQILAKEKDAIKLANLLPEVLEMTLERLSALKNKEIPLEELVVTQTLSRELEAYSVMSPAAVVARQLAVQGGTVERGQRVRFIFMAPGPGVHAWDLPSPPDPRAIDVPKYRELILRAVLEVLQPLGVTETILKNWVIGRAGYLAPPGVLATADPIRLALPLLADVDYLRVSN
jgi:DNA polymerase elongation subunit (family B)